MVERETHFNSHQHDVLKVILYIRVTKIVYVQIRNILICSFSWICIGDSFEHMHKMYSLHKWTPQRSSLLNSSSNILNHKLCIRHKITFLVVVRGLSKFRMQIFFKVYCKWQDRILSSKTEWLCQQNAFKIELWTKVRKKVSGHFNKSKIMLRNLIFDNNNKLFNSLNRPFNNVEYIFAWLHILIKNLRIYRWIIIQHSDYIQSRC